MNARLRIAVVGCGIAGAAVAARLGHSGHAVDAFERGAGSGGGAGLLLAPPALALLRDIGLEDEARHRGALVSGLHATRSGGKTCFEGNARRWGLECLGLGIERRVLHTLLMRGVTATATLHPGLGIDAVDAARGCLIDSDGNQRGPYDLVVACDGTGSRLRNGQPDLVQRAHRYPWTALSCLMHSAEGASVGTTLEQGFRGPYHASSWPVGAATAAGQAVCVSINVPTAAAPRFADPDAALAELSRLGLDRCARLDSLRRTGAWIRLTCSDIVLHRYFRQRLVFVGDAAHSLSPQLGQGARLALAGAANLASALERHALPDALVAYDRTQRALAQRYQRWSRWLTPLFQSPFRGAPWLRDRIAAPLYRLAPIEHAMFRLLCGPGEAR